MFWDLGVIPGFQRQVLIEHGLKVTRNDISAAQISLAREHIPQATLIQGDMLGLDDAAASFDAMLGFYSIPKEEQALVIEKTKGWLKPGGWLLCNFHIEGDVTREGWIEPDIKNKKKSSGLGVEGTRDIFRQGSNFSWMKSMLRR